MQNEQVSIFEKGEHFVSQRDQKLLSHLEILWQRSLKPSPETLQRIIEFLILLPEPQKTLGITKIAEYLVNSLSLHFLDIMALFQQNAENEGIDKKERIGTLEGVLHEVFSEMLEISKHVLVRSIDDLVALGNITYSLYTLSQVDTAEDAQSWMYELPILYQQQLVQNGLLAKFQFQFTVKQNLNNKIISGFASFQSFLPNPVVPKVMESPKLSNLTS
jgi:hypothetical protein